MRVREYHDIPKGLLTTHPTQLAELLGGPTLIHLRGAKNPPLFISTLLHGNEISGVMAMQAILNQYGRRKLPRSIVWFIGNPLAAAKKVRHLPDQIDFNRIWSGGDLPEQKMAKYIYSTMRRKGLFACIDIHNNTGRNPFYACVNKLDAPSLQLARKFSQTLVYFKKPAECLSIAFTKLCPTTTLECGHSGDKQGIHRVKSHLEWALGLQQVPSDPVDPSEVKIYQTFARVHVPDDLKISFKSGEGDLSLSPTVESLNFKTLTNPTLLGTLISPEAKLNIVDNQGNDVTYEHVFHQDELLFLKEGITPAMFTRNINVIKQDCFGYLMKRCEI